MFRLAASRCFSVATTHLHSACDPTVKQARSMRREGRRLSPPCSSRHVLPSVATASRPHAYLTGVHSACRTQEKLLVAVKPNWDVRPPPEAVPGPQWVRRSVPSLRG